MPCVTVLPKPNGLPIASTVSPTCTESSWPNVIAGRILAVGLQHCEIGFGIAASNRRAQTPAVGEHDLDVIGVLDHVIVGEHVAAAADDDAGPETVRAPCFLLAEAGEKNA